MTADTPAPAMEPPALETWRPVDATGYEVSDLGNVRRNGRLLKGTKNKTGYLRVSISQQNKTRSFTIHKLVLGAFVGPCPDGMQRAHLNGNPLDNRLCNLAYVTPSENNQHKHKHGTMAQGERHGCSRLTLVQVAEIRRQCPLIAIDARIVRLADEYGVSTSTIRKAARGDNWNAALLEGGAR